MVIGLFMCLCVDSLMCLRVCLFVYLFVCLYICTQIGLYVVAGLFVELHVD